MDLHTALMTVIAFSAVIAVLSTVFYALLNPVKENQARLEHEIKGIQHEIKGIHKDLSEIKTLLSQSKSG